MYIWHYIICVVYICWYINITISVFDKGKYIPRQVFVLRSHLVQMYSAKMHGNISSRYPSRSHGFCLFVSSVAGIHYHCMLSSLSRLTSQIAGRQGKNQLLTTEANCICMLVPNCIYMISRGHTHTHTRRDAEKFLV